jgi:peptide/nickel transport system substrate-binding protein
LRGDDRFTVRDLTSTSYYTLYLDTRATMFEDKNVRKALLQGINIESLVADAADGRGVPADTGIPARSWAHAPIDVPPFDPGAAATILERAGWQQGSDGIRSNGQIRLSFTLSTTADPRRVAIADSVSKQWRSIGVEARVQPLSSSSFIDDLLLPRKFEAALVAIDPGPDPDPYSFWHSSQIAPPGRNLAGYSEPRIDNTLERARQTTDSVRRRDLYTLFGDYLVAATPSIPLFAPVYAYVQADRVQGFSDTLLFTPASRFADVEAWYVATRVQ